MTDQEPISKEAQEAADKFAGSKKAEELREVIRELLPIAESYEMCFPKKASRQKKKVQAIIDRAKKLV